MNNAILCVGDIIELYHDCDRKSMLGVILGAGEDAGPHRGLVILCNNELQTLWLSSFYPEAFLSLPKTFARNLFVTYKRVQ